MRLNWNLISPMQCWCASLRKESNVFPSIQSGGDVASTGLGDGVSADAVSADVLLQLLVGVGVADYRAFVESGQLRPVAPRRCVLADAAALHVDRGAGYDLFSGAGLSAGVFPLLLRRRKKGPAVSVGDYSVVGQLPGAGVCLEDDSRLRRRAEYSAAVCALDQASTGVSVVQSVCRCADADAHLYAVCVSADLCCARAYTAQSCGSIARSRCNSGANFLEGDSPA